MLRALTQFGRQFVLPNGLIFLIAFVLQRLAIFVPSEQNAEIAVFVTGAAALALAWRFNLPRIALALLTVVILTVSSMGAATAPTPVALCALAIIAFTAPINVAFLLLIDDSNFDLESFGWWAAVISIEALLIYAMARSEATSVTVWLRGPVLDAGFAGFLLSPIAIVSMMAMAALLINFAFNRRASDAALFWTTFALTLALSPRASKPESLYFIAASFIVGTGILEGSYAVAYHDELTGLPGRRAYNKMSSRLSGAFAIAVVDIDHFKQFNDTYGHDVGDQVLRMVAQKLTGVTGQGKAFRLGGEEFAIVFPHASATDAFDHLDLLREDIELSPFMVRGPDRSLRERPERRKIQERRVRRESIETRVTVSIGVADIDCADDPEAIMKCADRALYKAKSDGRNRVVRFTGFAEPAKKRKRAARSKGDGLPEMNPDRFR
jgi:diguanylate cyclase (GGDEF)-like protein